MTIYFISVFGFYSLLLIVLWLGWRKVIRNKKDFTSRRSFISVVIAMRNEKANLESLLQSLADQNYQPTDFEIILVDDHSSDGSAEEAKNWSNRFSSLTILSLGDMQDGKKAALSAGINKARGEIIATTDADCILPANWLDRINHGFQAERINMLIGAMALQNEERLFSQLQSIEFASVVGTGMALCQWGKPTMCNGANLSFRKKTFEEVNGYAGNEQIASGDDEFLMRKIEGKYPGSIQILNPQDCVVVTKPQPSITDFIQQRLRWASKWKANSSIFARLLAVFMFGVQASWLILVAWLIAGGSLPILIVCLKLFVDLIFLSSVSSTLKMRFSFLGFVFLQFLYPMYVLYIGIFSQVTNHQWKGRITVTEKSNVQYYA